MSRIKDNEWIVAYNPVDRKLTGLTLNGEELMARRISISQDAGRAMILSFEICVHNDTFKFVESEFVGFSQDIPLIPPDEIP